MTTHALQSQRGFTIVETLVAITVLMIAIAGPLSVASKGLSAAVVARDQMVASFLAQESIEVVKNKRDNNLADPTGATSWLAGYSNCTPASAPCDASMIDSPQILSGLSTYPLKLATDGYSHGGSGSATPFSRYLYLTEVGSSAACQTVDLECTLVVVVSWNEGPVPYSVTVSSELLNSPR